MWKTFGELKPNTLGDFLAGTFAPLAVIWFIVAYLLQKRELNFNTRTLSEQVSELKKHSGFIEQESKSMEKDVFIASTLVLLQGVVSNIEGISREVTTWDDDMYDRAWSRFSYGDHGYLARQLLSFIKKKQVNVVRHGELA